MTPEHIKQTAIAMADESGLANISRNTLCARAGIPAGSFQHVTGMTFKALIRELAAEGHGGGAESVTRRRIDPELRREQVVEAALRVAERLGGVEQMTRDLVAIEAGVSTGTVSKYFNTMPQLRRAVARAAKRNGRL